MQQGHHGNKRALQNHLVEDAVVVAERIIAGEARACCGQRILEEAAKVGLGRLLIKRAEHGKIASVHGLVDVVDLDQ